jgi:hypothetical protein
LTISTLLSPGATLALPTGAEPPGPVIVSPVNFGSTPSEKVMRTSEGESTVPPTGGEALSSCAWAKAAGA